MSNQEMSEDKNTEHLEDIKDGTGCTEIWEKMSKLREEEKAERTAADD